MSFRRLFVTNPKACTGCRVCEMICSMCHGKEEVGSLNAELDTSASDVNTSNDVEAGNTVTQQVNHASGLHALKDFEAGCANTQHSIYTGGINPALSRIRVSFFPEKGKIIPHICQICKNTPCIAVCEAKALSQNETLGFIAVDEKNCNGCEQCIDACPFGAISMHPVKKVALICDLCAGKPQCVKYCMYGALTYLTPEEFKIGKRGKKR